MSSSSESISRSLEKALREGSQQHYTIRSIGDHKYHLKAGHLKGNIALGCMSQCYKYDVDLSDPDTIKVKSVVPGKGKWGGLLGMRMEKEEFKRVSNSLTKAFPSRSIAA